VLDESLGARLADELVPELGRAPTPHEIARRIGVSTEHVLEARAAAGAYRPAPLDPAPDDADAGTKVIDRLGIEDVGYQATEDTATLERLMTVLTDRERELLRLRFVEDLTQSEIGARLGISQMHVSRLIRQLIERLREAAEREALPG
jgi:RNA polymerase sigma-B factor